LGRFLKRGLDLTLIVLAGTLPTVMVVESPLLSTVVKLPGTNQRLEQQLQSELNGARPADLVERTKGAAPYVS
jgi:hypothetical protein